MAGYIFRPIFICNDASGLNAHEKKAAVQRAIERPVIY